MGRDEESLYGCGRVDDEEKQRDGTEDMVMMLVMLEFLITILGICRLGSASLNHFVV